VLIGIAAFSAILLAYWGSRSDRRVEEAHRYILELKEELATTAERAEAAHAQANRPIWERRNEEFEQMVAKPLEEPFRRVWNAAKRLIAPVQQFE
jgi:hypothetical protein